MSDLKPGESVIEHRMEHSRMQKLYDRRMEERDKARRMENWKAAKLRDDFAWEKPIAQPAPDQP